MARNGFVLDNLNNLATLNDFFNKHARHNLVFSDIDDYDLVSECKEYKPTDLSWWNRYGDQKSLYLVVQGCCDEQYPLQLFSTLEDAKKEIEKLREEQKIRYGKEVYYYNIVEFKNNILVKTFHQHEDGHFE